MIDYRKEVPSLELCKRLKELGFPQDGGGWYWVKIKKRWRLCLDNDRFNDCWEKVEKVIKAPTVAEMGEWLPPALNLKEGDAYLYIDRPEENLWILSYSLRDSFICPIAVDGETEANARAKLLIWLVENGYMSFKED